MKDKYIDEEIIQISLEMFKEASEARKPLENLWQKVYNFYNNYYDFSKKAEWQSKNFVPKIPNAVRAITGFIKQAFTNAGDDKFTIIALKEEYQDFCPVLKHYIDYWLSINKFEQLLDEAIISGLLSNLMIFKVYWKSYSDSDNTYSNAKKDYGTDIVDAGKTITQTNTSLPILSDFISIEQQYLSTITEELKIAVVDPFDFYIDPTGRGKYVIHRTTIDLSDLKNIGEEIGYDGDEIDKIVEDFKRQEIEYKEAIRQGVAPRVGRPSFRKQVEILEFWGDIIDSEGNILYENVTWSIANDKYLLRAPTKNPFWFKKAPFVWGPIIKKPFSVYHKNFFEDSLGLASVLTELLNMMLDTNAYATAKAFELDVDLIVDPEQFKTGIYPGKVFQKRTGGADIPLIREITLGQISPQILRIYQEMDREFQNATGTTEFLLGRPSTRGRPTATEVAIKSQQSSAFINDIANCIEDNVLSPLLRMMAILILQYQKSFDDIRLMSAQETIKQKMRQIAVLPEDEKRRMIDIFDFKVKFITGAIQKRTEIEKLLQLIEFMSQSPVADYINWEGVLKRLSYLLDIDIKNIVLPHEVVQRMRQQQIIQSLLMQQFQNTQKKTKRR